jgi:hypothetical protein
MARPLGLKVNAKNPATIANDEHSDACHAARDMEGHSAAIKEIVTTSTTKKPVADFALLRVVNTNAAVQFIYIGKDSAAPAGAPDITNGLALPPNESIMLYCPATDDIKDSIVVKTSHATVQVIIMES